jgi:hypothetical protein
MIRWLRVVLPAWWLLIIPAIVYAGFEAPIAYLEWKLGQPLQDFRVRRPSLFILCTFSVVYAVYRVTGFHPLTLPSYARWLVTTPWTSAKPLPLGPIHLVTQDVLILAGGVLLAWPVNRLQAFAVAGLFLLVYLIGLAGTLWLTGEKFFAYVVGFGAGLMLHLVVNLPAFGAATLATYGIAFWGLRRVLARFPWGPLPLTFTSKLEKGKYQVGSEELGWPFRVLAPKSVGFQGIQTQDAFFFSLLAGWFFYVVSWLLMAAKDSKPEHAEYALYIFLTFLIPGRFLIYLSGHLPPISFLGRVALGRWIIPKFDQIFLAPFLALLVGCSLPAFFGLVGIEPILASSLTLSLCLFTLLGMGPSLKGWRLTGHHRIFPLSNRATTIQIG